MATIIDALKGINAYPIPRLTLLSIIDNRGLFEGEELTQDILRSAEFKLAQADMLMWLSLAPNVSQGGQTYSFTDEQRVQLRNKANGIYKEYDAASEGSAPKSIYGYKGNKL